jgi:2-polyprenyl-6-methoxyphenol hydroxylase-like FAD-dependent oxidoreductase
MEPSSYDVVIVGARVAGSVLAARLGDGGMSVLLVDKASFPSPTISTHFFRGRAMLDVAEKLGILPEIMGHGSPPLYYMYSYANNEPNSDPVRLEEDFGTLGFNLSVRREVLDEILVRRAARSANVTLIEKTAATSLIWEDGRVCGLRLSARGNETEVRCQLLVGADGCYSRIAQWVGAANEIYEPGHRGIYYCYVHGFRGPLGKLDGIEFSRWGDEAAYVFPSDHELTCLAISMNVERYSWMRKDAKNRFWKRLHEYTSYNDRLSGLEVVGPPILGLGPVPNYMRLPYGPGWALVGDAGMHIDPWAGQGMDHASTHASLLADALLDFHSGRSTLDGALSAFHQKRNAAALKDYDDVVSASKDLRTLDPEYKAQQ